MFQLSVKWSSHNREPWINYLRKKIPPTDSAYSTTESKHNPRSRVCLTQVLCTACLIVCVWLTCTTPSPRFLLLLTNSIYPLPWSKTIPLHRRPAVNLIQIPVLRFLQWCHSSRMIKHSRQSWDSRQLFVVKSHHYVRVFQTSLPSRLMSNSGVCTASEIVARFVKVDELNTNVSSWPEVKCVKTLDTFDLSVITVSLLSLSSF